MLSPSIPASTRWRVGAPSWPGTSTGSPVSPACKAATRAAASVVTRAGWPSTASYRARSLNSSVILQSPSRTRIHYAPAAAENHWPILDSMAAAHLSPPQAELLAQETPACNSCGQAAATLVYEARDLYYGVDPRPYRVVRCDGCGLVYLTPRPTPADIA